MNQGYTLELRSFGWAINQLHNGDKVSRSGWNGKGMWLALQFPDAHSKMTLPYIYMRTAQGPSSLAGEPDRYARAGLGGSALTKNGDDSTTTAH